MGIASTGTPTGAPARRPLKSRQTAWARALARMLTKAGASPNGISVASVFFGLSAAICLWATARSEGIERSILFLAAAGIIQLRLLCNLLDGMVAIEGGKRASYGEVFNDMPDRFADVFILVGAGFAAAGFPFGRELGWIAAALALMTAYIRVLGGSLGLQQSFIGPMAKQHRMALLTGACVFSAFEQYLGLRGQIIGFALIVMVLGEIVTCARRTSRIVADLKKR